MRSENHIGKQISIFLTSAKLKKVWLATVLGVDESYLVRLLKKANIKTDRLEEICDATEHNFSKIMLIGGTQNKPQRKKI